MSKNESDRRSATRSSVTLSAVVKGRVSPEEFWKEDTNISTVSRLGASFIIDHPSKTGQLLSIISKMPRKYRNYDEDKKLYRVWGLVQYCSPVFESDGFQIGVAFIGKHAPASYLDDPLRTYRVSGMDKDGFWNVGETKQPFVSRAYHRFPRALEVELALIKHKSEEESVIRAGVTENISAAGASVFADIYVDSGDAVKFTCKEYDFESVSVVRNRQSREGGRITIHLKFAEPDFPVARLVAGAADAEDIDGDLEPDTEGGDWPQVESEEKVVEDNEAEEQISDESDDDREFELELDDPDAADSGDGEE